MICITYIKQSKIIINNKQKDNIRRIVDKPYSAQVEKNVKSMPYDYRNIVMDTHKKNKKIKSIT